MDDLVVWLRAQLDEDERIARAATLGPWVQSGVGDYGWTVDFGRPGAGVETSDTDQGLADADFIATHNPARVLREIKAKRAILRELPVKDWHEPCSPLVQLVLAHMAAPYNYRPGYRGEWRP
ncbi:MULTISPECIES: DUF6221 family protein [unclassified Streptomyces]|uniref:DUF6221 family protein n=1 Tax=unclassified Streptomyces TaxID=2593676 RepID=UPI0033A31ABA